MTKWKIWQTALKKCLYLGVILIIKQTLRYNSFVNRNKHIKIIWSLNIFII